MEIFEGTDIFLPIQHCHHWYLHHVSLLGPSKPGVLQLHTMTEPKNLYKGWEPPNHPGASWSDSPHMFSHPHLSSTCSSQRISVSFPALGIPAPPYSFPPSLSSFIESSKKLLWLLENNRQEVGRVYFWVNNRSFPESKGDQGKIKNYWVVLPTLTGLACSTPVFLTRLGLWTADSTCTPAPEQSRHSRNKPWSAFNSNNLYDFFYPIITIIILGRNAILTVPLFCLSVLQFPSLWW